MAIASAPTQETLTHYLLKSPDTTAKQLNRRSIMWDIAAKATLAALFVITSAIVIMSVLCLSLSPGFLGLSVGLALATPLLFHFEKSFANRSRQLKYEAWVERGVAEQSRQLKADRPKQIADFYQKHHIDLKTGPDRSLLLARFRFWEHVANCTGAEASLYLDPALPGNKLVNQPKEIQLLTRRYGWRILKEAALPAKLQSAVMLHLLVNPFQEIDLTQVGRCLPQEIDPKSGEKEPQKQDPYFELANKRPPLTIEEILRCSPDELNQKLFV
jgi:hypothetical protein